MKKMNTRCEECNGHISYECEVEIYRCNECGMLTDNEGVVLYDVETMQDM